eukprot:381153_1
MAARREAGLRDDDDDQSAVSGINKRRNRLRLKKKKEAEKLAQLEEHDVDAKSQKSEITPVPKVETEEEKKRRVRAEKRAKKLEAMAERRNAGLRELGDNDDGTMVTGITKRHRIRRKKALIAAITPDEKLRADYKLSVYASIMNA